MADRSVLTHPLFTGVSRAPLAWLVAELAGPWVAGVEGRRFRVGGGRRKRAPGAGARHRLVFVDRLVAILIHLRHALPHSAPALLYGVGRSIVPRAVGEVRRLLAERGFAGPDRPGLRLRTLEDVFAYAQAEGVQLRLDATEARVRRPAAGRGGRQAFVSGKKRQNTMKATVSAGHQGRPLWTDALRPGRMHDATAARTAGISGCFEHFDLVQVFFDDGYLGLGRDHPGRALTPPRKLRPGAIPPFVEARAAQGTITPRAASRSNTPAPTTIAGSN